MSAVDPHELPADALLAAMRSEGAYAECYAVEVPRHPCGAMTVRSRSRMDVQGCARLVGA